MSRVPLWVTISIGSGPQGWLHLQPRLPDRLVRPQLLRRAFEHHSPVSHHVEPVRDAQRDSQLLLDQQDRDAACGDGAQQLGDTLDHLRGKAEMHLKLLVKDGNMSEALEEIVLPATVGGDYLTKLREKASRQRERQTKARAISVQVHKLFNPLEEEVSCKKVDSGGMLIDIAHLVDHKQIEKYQARYNSAARQFKDCELSVSGPWPPYHFLPGKLRTVTN